MKVMSESVISILGNIFDNFNDEVEEGVRYVLANIENVLLKDWKDYILGFKIGKFEIVGSVSTEWNIEENDFVRGWYLEVRYNYGKKTVRVIDNKICVGWVSAFGKLMCEEVYEIESETD